MATRQRLKEVVERLSNRSNLDGVRKELERREGRSVPLSEVQGKLDRLRQAVESPVGAKRINFTPEQFTGQGLTREQQVGKAALLNQRRAEEADQFKDEDASSLNELLGRNIRDTREQEAPSQPQGFGQRFLQELFGKQDGGGIDDVVSPEQRQAQDQDVLASQVDPRERELRDEAAKAIANGADAVEVNKRLNTILKGS